VFKDYRAKVLSSIGLKKVEKFFHTSTALQPEQKQTSLMFRD